MGKQVSEKLSFAEQRQCKNNMWHAVEGQVEKHTTTKYRFMYVIGLACTHCTKNVFIARVCS